MKRFIKKVGFSTLKMRYEKKYTLKNGDLSYLYVPFKKSNSLTIVFSAFPEENSPAVYNYIRTLREIPSNKLFIMDDFGPGISGGSYYLGKDKDFYIAEGVMKLIDEICIKYNISKMNTTTFGTSKGGFAALYFAFKCQIGNVIVGAPQTKLGDYLNSSDHKKYLEYITGESSNKSRLYLNKLLYEEIDNKKVSPKVFIHVGEGEHHYQDHVRPFCKILEKNNIVYNLDLGNYSKHSEVANYFPNYAISVLLKILSETNQY